MAPSEEPRPVTSRHLTEVLAGVETFAMRIFDQRKQVLAEPVWIQDPELVAAFVDAIDHEHISRSSISSLFDHTTLVKVVGGRLYSFRIFGVTDGQPGFLLLTDGHCPLRQEFGSVVAKAYDLEIYDSHKESEIFRRRSQNGSTD